MIDLAEWLQRKVDPEYRRRAENKDKFLELRQVSFEAYLAGSIAKEEHEARVAELREEYLVSND